MWYLFSFILLCIGCALCCAGELWAVVLYVPFIISMVVNEITQSRQGNISHANSKEITDNEW